MGRARRMALCLLPAAGVVTMLSGQAWASAWRTTVTAVNSGQAQTQGTPSAPTSVSAACVSSSTKQIKVTWSAVTRATSYSVFQSTTSSTSGYSQVVSGVTSTSWTSGLLSNGHYWYEVTALIGTNWQSPKSAATSSITISSNNPNCALG